MNLREIIKIVILLTIAFGFVAYAMAVEAECGNTAFCSEVP